MTSVMFGIPVMSSPWAIFEELGRRGWAIGLQAAGEGRLRATAAHTSICDDGSVDVKMRSAEGASAAEVALLLARAVAAPDADPRAWEI